MEAQSRFLDRHKSCINRCDRDLKCVISTGLRSLPFLFIYLMEDIILLVDKALF